MKPALGIYEIEGYMIDSWIITLNQIVEDKDTENEELTNAQIVRALKQISKELEDLYPVKEL